jgi:intein/homing endonuclease
MIVTDKFKSYSLFTFQELQESITQDIENMTDAERAVFFEMLSNPSLESDLTALELDRDMVSVEQWIEDDYYMGSLGKSIYKPWKDDLIELFDSGQYDTAIIQGGIGCLAGETLVQMADGDLKRLKDLNGKSTHILAFDKPNLAVGVHNGFKLLYEIKLKNGLIIKATSEHKFMTQDGWTRTDQLDINRHKIKSPRLIKTVPTEFLISFDQARFLGALFSCQRIVKRDNGYLIFRHDKDKIDTLAFLADKVNVKNSRYNDLSLFFADSDIKSFMSIFDIDNLLDTKKIPSRILKSDNSILAAFLSGLSLNAVLEKNIARTMFSISYFFSSKSFCEEIQLAFRRFGIRFKSFHCSQGKNKTRRICLEITAKDSLIDFYQNIGFVQDSMRIKLKEFIPLIELKLNRVRLDFIPTTYKELVSWCKRHKCDIWKQKSYWLSGKSKDLYASYREVKSVIDHYPHMICHAWEIQFDPDSFWDDVVSIKEAGYENCYDLVVPDENCYLSNGILCHNSGKSTFSHLVVLRMLYEASCLKNPAISYGLAANSVIGFCSLAKSKETARRVVFDQIAAKIQESPYFKYDFAPLKPLKDEIIFPKGLAIICGSSTDTSIIGMNIFGGIIDEVNFWGKVKKSNASFTKNWGSESKSGRLFDSVRRRMKSRYVKKGKLPGIIMLISSKTTKDSLTEQFIRKEQALGNKSTFVRDRSIIEMKRGSFSSKTFRVLVGTTDYVSRIIGDTEEIKDENALIVEIPEDFRVDFVNKI